MNSTITRLDFGLKKWVNNKSLWLTLSLFFTTIVGVWSQCSLACNDNVVLELPCADSDACSVTITKDQILENDLCLENIEVTVYEDFNYTTNVTFDLADALKRHTAKATDTLSGNSCWTNVFIIYPNEFNCFSLSASKHQTTEESVEVDISATAFQNIERAQFSIEWNPLVVEFEQILDNGTFDLGYFDISEIAAGKLHVDWSTTNAPVSIHHFFSLFTIQFNVIGQLGETTDILLIKNGNGIIAEGNQPLPFNAFHGQIQLVEPQMDLPLTILEGCAFPKNCAEQNSIEITAIGGTTPYSFHWEGPNGFSANEQYITNLTAGIYQLTITDASDNTTTGIVEVANSGTSHFLVDVKTTNASCLNATDGQLEIIEITGGQPPYQLAWSTGATDTLAQNLSQGLYTLTLTDDLGCTADFSYQITENIYFPRFYPNYEIDTPDCDGSATGSIALDFSSNINTTNYSYLWNTGATTDSIFNLITGLYKVTVTDTVSNCVFRDSLRLDEIENATATIRSTSGNGCENNAIRGFFYHNNSAPGSLDSLHTFIWNTGDTSEVHRTSPGHLLSDTLYNAENGLYQLTIFDHNGCSIQSPPYEFSCHGSPALSGSFTVKADKKNGVKGSQICVPVSYSGGGGRRFEKMGYTIEWDETVATFSHFNNTGSYVQENHFDFNHLNSGQLGFLWDASLEPILNLGIFSLDFNICFDVVGENGEQTLIEISESVQPFIFQTTEYTINNFTTKLGQITVGNEPIESPNVNTNIKYYGCDSVGINIEIFNPNLNFSWTGPNGFSSTEQSIQASEGGQYHLEITDENDENWLSEIVWLNYHQPIEVEANITVVTCDELGTIELEVSGGSGEYSYLWSNGVTTKKNENLSEGIYSVTIDDFTDCTNTLIETFSVESTLPDSVNIFSFNYCASPEENDGSITFNATIAGTNNYKLTSFDNLSPGFYEEIIMDANGCHHTVEFEISEADFTLTAEYPDCVELNSFDAYVDLTIVGDSSNLIYNWAGGNTTQDLYNVIAAQHSVGVTDTIKKCKVSETFIIGSYPEIEAAIGCPSPDENDGYLHLTVEGNAQFYQWNTGHEGINYENLAAGTYTVTVNEYVSNCSSTATFHIENFDVEITEIETGCANYNQTNGFIDLTITGINSNMVFNWNNGTYSEDLFNVAAGEYTLQILDTISFCEYVETFTVGEYVSIESNVFCENTEEENGAINLNIQSSLPFEFNWNTGFSELNYENLATGNYQITVSSSENCEVTENFFVGFTETIITDVSITCAVENSENGAIDLTVFTEQTPLVYSWNNGSSQMNLDTLNAGFYTVTISEPTGCQIKSDTIEVCEIDPPINCVMMDIAETTGETGDIICVPVQVYNFDAILSHQFTVSWNPQVLSFQSAENIALDSLDENNFGVSNLAAGNLTHAWYDTEVIGESIEDGAVIFDLCFELVGNEGSQSLIEFTNNPTIIEFYNLAEEELNFTGIAGIVQIGEHVPLNLEIHAGCILPAVCSGGNEGGEITIFPKGGEPPYFYAWTGPFDYTSTEKNQRHLPAGNYTVVVTDNAGNTVTDNFFIEDIRSNIIDFEKTPGFCPVDNAISVKTTSPQINYTFDWNTNANTQTIIGVENENYRVTVTDNLGCPSIKEVTFEDIYELNLTPQTTCEPNYGKSYALHTTLPEGGLLNVVWNDGFSMATSNNEVTRTDVPPGIYYATISNSTGCAVTTDTISLAGIVDIGGDSLVCEGSEVPLSVTTIGEMTFDWSPAESLSCTDCPNPTAMPDVPTTYTVTAQSEDDNCPDIRQILVYVDTACVWPGDVNYNGIVNHFDILPIGLGNGEMGPVRPNATIEWQAEAALPYLNETPESHVNYKHADTDGNGLVDANDTLAIVQNWDNVHNLWSPDDQFTDGNNNGNALTDPQFYIEQDTAYEGDAVALKIMLGTEDNPAIDVYGLGFSVQYEANMVQPGSAVVVFDTSWIGNINDDMIAIQRNYVPNGKVDVGLTRLDHQNVSGFGQIATCYIVIEDNIFEPPLIPTHHVDDRNGEATEMFMTILRGQIINNEEKDVPAFYTPSNLVILERETNVFENELSKEVILFPNPVNEELFLTANQLKMNHLTIFDWSGKQIFTEVIDDFEKKVEVKHLAAGTYFMEIETAEGRVFKRFVKK